MNIQILIFLLLSVFSCCTQNYHYEKGVIQSLTSCPGKYCGRMKLSNGSWSPCGACERGMRRNSSGACSPCNDFLTLYDWFYLGFMFLIPLVYHVIRIDMSSNKGRFTKEVLILGSIAVLEVFLSALISVLLFKPKGHVSLNACRVRDLADWYPLLHNPNPNYAGQLYCTQEAVYPLYSIVFVFYTLSLICMLLVRSWLSAKLLENAGKVALYSAMYFFPVLILIHSVFGGLIYYSFPYIVIVFSIVSNATYFAFQPNQDMKDLFLSTFRNSRNLSILLGHWFLHAYGIMSATQFGYPALLLFIPLPSLFYILTSKFTDPSFFM